MVAAALAAFVTGDIAYDALTEILHYRDPFPSVADAFYMATYPLFACGLLGLLRARSPERKLGPLLDALIVTTSCGIFLMDPYVRAANTPLLDKVLSIYYPLGDIAILCVLAQLVLAVGLRNWSVRLLTLGALGLLVADVFYGDFQLSGSWRGGGPTDLGWVLFYICWGAASLHPSMRELTETHPPRETRLSTTALVVLGAVTLLAPGLLVWRTATDGAGGDVGVIGVASGVVFLLVMARLTSLARAQAAQAARERSLIQDVSDRKVLDAELRHQAFHDSLTNLANRSLFHDRVDHALSRPSRLGTDVSVLLLDIDDFKAVNDTLGHPAGDQLLIQFAERLLSCLRAEDTAARLGGDEFAVCIELEEGRPDIAAAAQRMLETMAQPSR